VLVNKLVPSDWLLTGALEVWRLWLRLRKNYSSLCGRSLCNRTVH